MNKFILLILLSLVSPLIAALEVSSGSVTTIKQFPSKYVSARDVHVWLPEGYQEDKRYAVLYMHDGQMLFDAKTTWNKQEWGVDEIAQQLMHEDKVMPFIVVGINNGGNTRHSDYFPQKPFELLDEKHQKRFYQMERSANTLLFSEKVNSDNYLKFIVSELKPYIDANYPVYTDRSNTYVMGSSMGGLISLYASIEYPEVFGGAACLSTHWIGVMPHRNNPMPAAFAQYLEMNLPKLADSKIYFDYGDQTLDAFYPPHQKKVDGIMKEAGFNHSNWQTLFFKGQNHSEDAWRSRLDKPLLFLFGSTKE